MTRCETPRQWSGSSSQRALRSKIWDIGPAQLIGGGSLVSMAETRSTVPSRNWRAQSPTSDLFTTSPASEPVAFVLRLVRIKGWDSVDAIAMASEPTVVSEGGREQDGMVTTCGGEDASRYGCPASEPGTRGSGGGIVMADMSVSVAVGTSAGACGGGLGMGSDWSVPDGGAAGTWRAWDVGVMDDVWLTRSGGVGGR